MSYLEISLRLGDRMGSLPRDWPGLSASRLAETNTEAAGSAADDGAVSTAGMHTRSRWEAFPLLETAAALRAVAIVLIVATHADLIGLKGGAHLLLAVAGYNLARFQLADAPGVSRVRRLGRSVAQIAVPAVVWIAAVALVSGKYTWTTALLVNNLAPGDGRWNEQWQFWFLEAAVWAMLGLAALFAITPIDRLERRHPWVFAIAMLSAALALRFAGTGIEALHVDRYAIVNVLWFLALGWAVARADTAAKRIAVSVVLVVCTAGFFGDQLREGVIVVGVLALIWAPQLRLPRRVIPVVRVLAGASLFIYLTHWVVYPAWEQSAPWLGTLLSIGVGIAAWQVHRLLARMLASRRRRRGGFTRPGSPAPADAYPVLAG